MSERGGCRNLEHATLGTGENMLLSIFVSVCEGVEIYGMGTWRGSRALASVKVRWVVLAPRVLLASRGNVVPRAGALRVDTLKYSSHLDFNKLKPDNILA